MARIQPDRPRWRKGRLANPPREAAPRSQALERGAPVERQPGRSAAPDTRQAPQPIAECRTCMGRQPTQNSAADGPARSDPPVGSRRPSTRDEAVPPGTPRPHAGLMRGGLTLVVVGRPLAGPRALANALQRPSLARDPAIAVVPRLTVVDIAPRGTDAGERPRQAHQRAALRSAGCNRPPWGLLDCCAYSEYMPPDPTTCPWPGQRRNQRGIRSWAASRRGPVPGAQGAMDLA